MDDLISRKAAIEEIRTYITEPNISDDESEIKGFNDGLDLAISVLSVLPSAQPVIIRCKDCRWGKEVCGNIECFADTNVPPEYHGYEWFCPNGEMRTDE